MPHALDGIRTHNHRLKVCDDCHYTTRAFVPFAGMRLVGVEPTPFAWKAKMLTFYTSAAGATDGIRTRDGRLRTFHDYLYTTVADATGRA
jgi:hypothetical protein